MTNKLTTITPLFVLLLTLQLPAQADQVPNILMSDSFERNSGSLDFAQNGGFSDWGFNDNAFGGTFQQLYNVTDTDLVGADQQYVLDPDPFNPTDGTGRLWHGTSLIDLDLAALSPWGYESMFSFKRGLNNSIGFIVGRSAPNGGLVMSMNDLDTDYGIKIRPFDGGNDIEFYSHGALVGSIDGFWVDSLDAQAWHDVVVTVNTSSENAYSNGDTATIILEIDGDIVHVDNFDWDGISTGSFGFTSSGDDAEIDSLALASESLPGDANGDGFVGISDLSLILSNWNQEVPPAEAMADIAGSSGGKTYCKPDGFVGIADLNKVLGNFNLGTPPAESVPEPSSLVSALCLGMPALIRGRRRQ